MAAPAASADAGFSSSGTSFGFDSDAVGSAPLGLTSGRTGEGREGKWVVRAEADAPSGPNILAQTDADPTDSRFPILRADEPTLDDVSVSVRCKPVSGKVDQACGLVCRLKDANNYVLTRANALENNVRLYVVENGRRQQVASWSGKVTAGEWHRYRFVCHGDLFTVAWDGVNVITHRDKTLAKPGKVGLWTKADSITYFDDLSVTPVAQL